MHEDTLVISVKGEKREVPAIRLDDIVLLVAGKILKIAQIHDEAWMEPQSLPDPLKIIDMLRNYRKRPDIFTFSQRFSEAEPRYNFPFECTNVAAISINSYDYWWKKQINAKTRNMVRKAQKNGVDVRLVAMDEKLIEEIVKFNNETPMRQGKPFWHYGKDSAFVRKGESNYLERSDFYGAYHNGELIGYMKVVYMGEVAGIMQILSMFKDRDKAPNNALISKAVETCASRGIKYLFYGKYIYGKKGHSSFESFKKHNGFKKIEFSRYYVPLTIKGQLAVKMGFHKGWRNMMPVRVRFALTDLRFKYYVWR